MTSVRRQTLDSFFCQRVSFVRVSREVAQNINVPPLQQLASIC